MAFFSDEALVLDSHPFKDRHLLLSVLTRSYGVVRGVLRSARGAKAPHGAATQILSQVHTGIWQSPHAELASFRQIRLVTSSFPLAADLERATAAAVVAELLLTFCPPGEPVERPFRLGVSLLKGLLAGTDPHAAVAYSQLWVITLNGLLPPLKQCAECGAELTMSCAIRPSDNQPLCPSCAPAEAESLSPQGFQFLVACRHLPVTEVPGPVPPDCRYWLDRLARQEAERPLRALEFFRRHCPGD
jgi:DNA repair protein RecO (recombination protein O)